MKKQTDGVKDADRELREKRERSGMNNFIEKMKSRQSIERKVERCRSCNAKYIRFRSKMESWICTGCGFSWTMDEEQQFQNIENTLIAKDFQIRYHLPLPVKALETIVDRLEKEKAKA